jgi:hypothetical protein
MHARPAGVDIKLLGGLFLFVSDAGSGWSILRPSWTIDRLARNI